MKYISYLRGSLFNLRGGGAEFLWRTNSLVQPDRRRAEKSVTCLNRTGPEVNCLLHAGSAEIAIAIILEDVFFVRL